MIKDALQYLGSVLRTTGLFTKVYDLCELLTVDGKTYPAYYVGAGEYKDISGFDRNDGTGYFRLNGQTKINSTDDKFQTTSCPTVFDVSIPLILVCVVSKKRAICDDEFASQSIAEQISNALNGAGGALNMVSSSCTVNGYTTNGNEILKAEYKDPSINEFNPKFAYISFDLTFDMTVDSNCIETICY